MQYILLAKHELIILTSLIRNTIGRSYNRLSFQQQVYAVPRANPPLVKMPTDPTLSTTTYNDEDSDHDYVEPPIELTSEDEEDPGYYRVPRPLQSSMSDTTYNKWNGSNSIYSPPPPSEHSDTTNHNSKLEKMESSSIDCGGGVYESVPEESPCEMEPGALTNDHLPPSSSAVYQNADDARVEAEAFKSSRSNSSELLNIISSSNTGQTDTSSSLSPVSITTTSPPPTQSNTPSSTTGPLRKLAASVLMHTVVCIVCVCVCVIDENFYWQIHNNNGITL